jgi:hypothetical protein
MTLDVDGQRHMLHARPHKGSPLNPFTWSEACEKFRRYSASVLSTERAALIIDAVGRLEQAADRADVAQLLSQ